MISNIICIMRKISTCIILALMVILSGCQSNPVENNGNSSPTGYIENKGSDTIVNLALAWAEKYRTVQPNVNISVTGGGSGTGITALINGTVDIANASRQIKTEELEEAKKNGLDPQEFVIARDAIAVIVNPQNPVDHLTLAQLAAIYRGEINNWKEVGGEDRVIVRLSRETNSGTHVYFLESVVRMGSKEDKTIFSRDTLLLPSSEGIISEVRDNPNAIGYDGLGYITPEVKMLGISAPETPDVFVIPSVDTVINNTYLISRNLYMYTQNVPTGVIKTYLDWIFTAEAQSIVKELGFIPVTGE